jgi:uncharacterized caspase-like protein
LEKSARGLFTGIDTTQIFEGASRAAIFSALNRLRDASPRDVAIIYMAGHGLSSGGDWYFVPEDVTELDPRRITAGGISAATLRSELEAIGPQRVLLLIDACDSGLAVNPVRDFSGLRALRLLARSVGLHVLAATDRDRFALEVDALSHSVFAYSLLEGLKGKGDRNPRNGLVSVGEIEEYVEETVPQVSRQYAKSAKYPDGYPQTPIGYSQGAGFDLATVR